MQETNYSNEESKVGMGPWPIGQPLPMGDCYDAALLRKGSRRSVPDRFRYWSNAAIIAQLDWELSPHPEDLPAPCLEIAIENIGHDFNIGSIIHIADGLGVRQVHILGWRRFNRRGAMVTGRYLHLQFHEVPATLAAYAAEKALTTVGMDNLPDAENLESCELSRRCLMIFGEESSGITPATQEILNRLIQIAQYGFTRSLNVGHAAAISTWAWVRAYPRRLS